MGIDNRHHFCICKNDNSRTILKVKQKFKQYDIGDNDFYWLNSDNKKNFFIIPEKILIDKGLVGNNSDNNPIQLKVSVTNPLHKRSEWLNPYMFDYENIDQERLLNLFK